MFSASNGRWEFSSLEPRNPAYPPGAYVIRVTASTGNSIIVTAFHDFSVNLVDPCPTSLAITSPFVDGQYTLRNYGGGSVHEQDFSSGLYTQSAAADCGPVAVKFYLLPTMTELEWDDPGQPIQIDSSQQKLRVGYSEDASIAGDYLITFTVVMLAYDPIGSVELDTPFLITIVNPCQPPSLLQADTTALTDQTYTITEPELILQLPFTVEPDWCQVLATVLPQVPALESLVSFELFSGTLRIFNDEDLSLSALEAPFQ